MKLSFSIVSGREDMEKERKGASFPVREMTFYMDGGEEVTKVRRNRKYVFYYCADERSNDA